MPLDCVQLINILLRQHHVPMIKSNDQVQQSGMYLNNTTSRSGIVQYIVIVLCVYPLIFLKTFLGKDCFQFQIINMLKHFSMVPGYQTHTFSSCKKSVSLKKQCQDQTLKIITRCGHIFNPPFQFLRLQRKT